MLAAVETMLMALVGRTYGFGLVGRMDMALLLRPLLLLMLLLLELPQVSGEKRERLEGCCRTQKTKVLLMKRREHCG